MTPEFHLFLPQMRMPMDTLVDKACTAEAAGFTGIALMDHLAPPMAEQHDMWEAITTATWLAAHTTTLTVSHLVLCDAFRHPAVLARQAVTIDHVSGGRFELGIGWGSVPTEFDTFDIGDTAPRARVSRLAETLEIIEALWSGESIDFQGDYFQITNAQQQPTPMTRIPIVIGGAGPKTLALVEKHADWWNCPIHRLDRFDEMRSRTGSARASIQEQVTFIGAEAERQAVTELADRRFSQMGRVVGSSAELQEHYGERNAAGVDRFYVWFTDFATTETLEQFGAEVIGAFESAR